MRTAIYILEGINAMLGIIVSINALNKATEIIGVPIGYWLFGIYIIFALGMLLLFLSDKKFGKKLYDEIYPKMKGDIARQQKGTIASITEKDRNFIHDLGNLMFKLHGHEDYHAILAEKASGVQLNELMYKNCSKCLFPRNQKSPKETTTLGEQEGL